MWALAAYPAAMAAIFCGGLEGHAELIPLHHIHAKVRAAHPAVVVTGAVVGFAIGTKQARDGGAWQTPIIRPRTEKLHGKTCGETSPPSDPA